MSVSNGNREAPHIFLQSNILLDSSWKYNSSAPKVSKDFKSTNTWVTIFATGIAVGLPTWLLFEFILHRFLVLKQQKEKLTSSLIKAQAEIDWFKNELARIKNGTSDEQKQLLQNEGETKSKKQNFTSQAQDRKVIEKLTFSIQEVKDLKEELRQAIELNRQLEKKLEYKKEELKEAEEQLKQTVDEVKFYQEKSIDLEKQLREAEEYISSGDECFKKISNDKKELEKKLEQAEQALQIRKNLAKELEQKQAEITRQTEELNSLYASFRQPMHQIDTLSIPDLYTIEDYEGQFWDLLLEDLPTLIANATAGERFRKADVYSQLKSIIQPTGYFDKIQSTFRDALRDKRVTPKTLQPLEKLGFKFERGGKHYKLSYKNYEHKVTIAGTPSDIHAIDALIREVKKTWF